MSVLKMLKLPKKYRHLVRPLLKSADTGDIQRLQDLLKKGANVNAVVLDAFLGLTTALIAATASGHFECMELLLQNGANVNMVDYRGETAIMHAVKCINGSDKAMRILIQAGADLNIANKYRKTPLMCAIEYQEHRSTCIDLLIEAGADVNAVSLCHLWGSGYWMTPLSSVAANFCDDKHVVQLIKAGADLNFVCHEEEDETALTREHRDLNIHRIGYVASEITKNGGAAICAPIAPYAVPRKTVRELIEPLGGFLEIHVATPLEVCEERDRKGLYAKARAGIIKEFTGISDPYEEPENPELRIDTVGLHPELAAHRIFVKLESLGFIR